MRELLPRVGSVILRDMLDNLCKFLAETFPQDYATWLLGHPIPLTRLSPTELSAEPIRADSLILEQSEDVVLHLEFQTEPDATMPLRMLDYWVRVYRRFPHKTMHQVVIYLKKTQSEQVYRDRFQVGNTVHTYRVVRLWEQPLAPFLSYPGLLPLAVLTQVENPTIVLREIATILETIPDNATRRNLATATAVFGGLVVSPDIVKAIFRSEVMKESAIYQEILQEGRQEGHREGEAIGQLQARLELAQKLLQRGMSREEVIGLTGLVESQLPQG